MALALHQRAVISFNSSPLYHSQRVRWNTMTPSAPQVAVRKPTQTLKPVEENQQSYASFIKSLEKVVAQKSRINNVSRILQQAPKSKNLYYAQELQQLLHEVILQEKASRSPPSENDVISFVRVSTKLLERMGRPDFAIKLLRNYERWEVNHSKAISQFLQKYLKEFRFRRKSSKAHWERFTNQSTSATRCFDHVIATGKFNYDNLRDVSPKNLIALIKTAFEADPIKYKPHAKQLLSCFNKSTELYPAMASMWSLLYPVIASINPCDVPEKSLSFGEDWHQPAVLSLENFLKLHQKKVTVACFTTPLSMQSSLTTSVKSSIVIPYSCILRLKSLQGSAVKSVQNYATAALQNLRQSSALRILTVVEEFNLRELGDRLLNNNNKNDNISYEPLLSIAVGLQQSCEEVCVVSSLLTIHEVFSQNKLLKPITISFPVETEQQEPECTLPELTPELGIIEEIWNSSSEPNSSEIQTNRKNLFPKTKKSEYRFERHFKNNFALAWPRVVA